VAAEVARAFGWRWVFLGLLPVVAVAGSIAVPALVRIGPPAAADTEEQPRLIDALRTAAGATLLLAGLTLAAGSGDVLAGCALIAVGAVAGLPALRRLVLAGIGGMAMALQPAVPAWSALAAWTVAGFGMGLAYAPISLMMLRKAPPGREGRISASLNLADVLGTAIGIGIGGAAVAATAGTDLRLGVTAAFAIMALAGVTLLAVTPRLPAGTGSAPPPSAEPVPAPAPGGATP